MPLAPSRNVGVIAVVFDVPGSDKGYAVALPSAEFFEGSWTSGLRERNHAELLDRGLVDAAGGVRLANGETVHAVEIEPARLPLTPTKLDWRIIHVAIACCRTSEAASPSERENERRVREKCYRPVRQAVPAKYEADIHMMPNIRPLDCSTLTDLRVPSLKAIAAHWTQVYPDNPPPSPQKIAETLADFRMRFPRHL